MSQKQRTEGQYEGIEYTLRRLQALLEQDPDIDEVKRWLREKQEWLTVRRK